MTDLAISEADFQTQVVELARLQGYWTMHVRRSIGKESTWTTATSVKGWPDLTIWKPDRFLMAELKTDTGKLTDDQRNLLLSLRDAGIEVYVWRPFDLDDINQILRARPDNERLTT